MQRVAQRAVQPTAIHAVVVLQVSDRRPDGLALAQPAILLRTQAIELALMA
jgi:hypothetical protein